MKRLLTMMVVGLFAAGVLGGCNTVAGAGKDIKGAGEKIEDSAKK